MLLSAARRNIILLPMVFLTGVWVGHSWLNDQPSESQDNPRGTEIRHNSEQRTPFPDRGEITVKNEDNRVDHLENKLGYESTQAFSDMSEVISPSSESGSESYSFYESVALDSSTIEPSSQFIENDMARSLEEAGVSPEEIPGRVDSVMEMILQNDQQTPEAYPNISPDADVPCID